MKKIALVYDALYPYVKGGGEKRFYDAAEHLSRKGYEVHLYGMKFWKGKDKIKKKRIYYHGLCKAVNLYNREGKRSLLQPIYFGISCLKLIKEDFDVIDCCGFPYYSLFTCRIICSIKRKTLYSTWHEVWGKEYWMNYLGKKGIIGYFIEKSASTMPDKIIAVSEKTKNDLREKLNYRKKSVVIPNGIDFESINKIKKSKEVSDIIYAGRLIEYKNVNFLIKSTLIIKKKNPKIKVIILGDGPERKKLEELSEKLDLSKNIIFKGSLEKIEEVYSLMKSSKVFVLPSSREGFGIVVLEANACGIPAITVNEKDNASKFLIKNGVNGLVCALEEKELAKKVMEMIALQKKIKNKCINEAKKYDWKNIVNRLEEVYAK